MDFEFSQEELEQILYVMRVLAPDIGEDRFQVLLDAQDYLLASGFLDAVWGIVRLQEEEDVNLTDTIDRFQSLLNENKKLNTKQASLKEKIDQDQKVHQQILNDIAVAKKELEEVSGQVKKEKDELAALVMRAESEKKRIDSNLEKYKEKVGIIQNEIKAAGSIKSAVKKCGFSLEMILNLVKEFAPYKDARKRLVENLEKEGTLTQQIISLEKKAEEQNNNLTATITQLTSQKNQEENAVNELKKSCHQWETRLKQLQADVEEEQQLRQFMVRYKSSAGLMECLAGWKQILFLRCDNPGCEPFSGINHFWTDKQATRCPHCGSNRIYYDEELYNILNLEMRPLNLILG